MGLCECGCGEHVGSGNRYINGHNKRGNDCWKKQHEPQLCACGCGEYASPGKTYVRGHHAKVDNPFKGKHHTEEFKNSMTGDGNPNWSGGKYVDTKGYVRVLAKDHKRADVKGYVKEHILVWMVINGDIPDDHCIHHINGDKTDNRIENLEMLTMSEHNALGKICNEYGRKYSNSTVLGWVELHRYDKLSYTKIAKKVNVDRDVVYKNVKRFERKYNLPDWASHQIYRESGLLENICKEHSVGHPHEVSVKEMKDAGFPDMGIHGCCGCCCPGMKEDIERAYKDKWGEQ